MRAPLPCLLLLCLVAGCGLPTNHTGQAFTASGETIAFSGGEGGPANACFRCHGRAGQGDGVSVPRLAGMNAGYLQKQLDDYASGLRQDKVMGPVARWLSVEDRLAVAAYYADLPAPQTPPAAEIPAPALYRTGDPARGLVACAVCHGDRGEGVGPGNPALAGQPAAYAHDQLLRWKKAERRNDPGGVMRAAAHGLTDAEARAIAAWLERQSASRPPDSDAARLSAAASAWERLAAFHGRRRPGR